MRLVVIGPGALGLLMACRLSQAGAQVSLLDYRPQRAQKLAQEGVYLEDQAGEHHFSLPADTQAQVLGQCDLALVCVKAYQTQVVAQELGRHLGPGARVLTVQNGAGNVETLGQAVGLERVLGGITSEGATLLAQGRVRHAGQGQTHLGPALGQPDDFCGRVVELFQGAGFETAPATGVANLIWTKLVINVGINALTAILDVNNGVLLELESAGALMERAVGEAVAVGRATGIEFLHQDMLAATQEVARRTAGNISSMRQDVAARRRTEIDYINGAVCRKGRELSLATPVNETLSDLVRAIEDNYA